MITMYHDQGQIAIKLMGFERGVTVQGGLPVPITTPAHGTAFGEPIRGAASNQRRSYVCPSHQPRTDLVHTVVVSHFRAEQHGPTDGSPFFKMLRSTNTNFVSIFNSREKCGSGKP